MLLDPVMSMARNTFTQFRLVCQLYPFLNKRDLGMVTPAFVTNELLQYNLYGAVFEEFTKL